MLNSEDTDSLILFLTDYVTANPKDSYNAYWLLMVAYAYQLNGANPIAEMYFERILNNYDDLLVKGKSVHMLCLQNLIQISENPNNRIIYFSRLISQFPDKVSKTELYYRLALEYEKLGGQPIEILLAGRNKVYKLQGIRSLLPLSFEEF